MKYRFKPIFSLLMHQLLFALSLYLLYQPFQKNNIYSITISLSWLFFILSINFLLSRWHRFIYSTFFVSLFAIALWMQTVYERAFRSYARLNLLFSLNQEAVNSWQSIQEFIQVEDWRFVLIVAFFIGLLYILALKTQTMHVKPWFRYTTFALILAFSAILSFGFQYQLWKDRTNTDQFLYYKTNDFIYSTVPSTKQLVDKFGVLGLLQKDLTDMLITPLLNNAYEENKEISILLSNQTNDLPNAYTGLFEGKSVLMIEAESLMHLAIHPVLTPTLYKLRAEGFNFTGYNSALLPGSTSDTEFMANTSLIPANDGFGTFMKYAQNDYPLTLAKVFNENDYYSLAAHNNYGEFYNRNVVLPAFGYDFFDSYRMGFEGLMIPDSEFLEPIKWISYEKERFFSFWISFNGHQPYSMDNLNPKFTPYYDQAKELYPELPESDLIYLAKTMDFDRALSAFIRDFTYSNRIDDLVIIFFGDHFAKGAFVEQSSIDMLCEDAEHECLSTPFVVWHHATLGIEIDKTSNALDILPTTLDLLGLEYDHTLALGSSIFNPNYEGFYYNAWGDIIVGDFEYNQTNNTLNGVQLNKDETLDPKIIEAIELIQIAPTIVENNYFASDEWIKLKNTLSD